MKRIVLVGGGTGGHFYPLIAVAQHIRLHKNISDQIELYYMGPEPYNQSSLDSNNIKFVSCPAGKSRRYFSPLNFLDVFKNFFGIFVAIWKLYVIYPDVVFSKGGYTSVPVTLAAFFLKIPVVVHESDSMAGRANKLAGKFARYIAISFPSVAEQFPPEKTALTGIPIRTQFYSEAQDPSAKLGLPTDKPLLFITGGSLGAEKINTLVLDTLDELLPYFTILHQTGDIHEDSVKNLAMSMVKDQNQLSHYFVKGSLTGEEMHYAQSAASIVISRAGATSIFEIALKGKPSIIIPIPKAVSHDQRENAYAFARAGAATVLEEDNMTDGLLTTAILNILNDRELYSKMSVAAKSFATTEAAEKVVQILVKICNEHR